MTLAYESNRYECSACGSVAGACCLSLCSDGKPCKPHPERIQAVRDARKAVQP